MTSGVEQRTGTPPEGGRRGRTSLLLAGVFLGLVVLAGLVVALFGGGHNTQNNPPPASSSPGAIAPPDAQLDQTVPTSPPASVRWELYQRVALPYSATAGPQTIDGSVARGYAHTPTGALIAAAQIPSRSLLSPDDSWRQVVNQQVMPGPGRDRFTQLRSQITTDDTPDPRLGQIAGFRFITYRPEIAVIQLATKFTNGHMQVTTTTMQWDGDWKEVLQPDGSDSPTVQAIPDLTGIVGWSGV
ncbi:MAG: hypothetical protein ACRDR6_31215 [Pseudonocardiaceae bacterium]